MNIEALKTISNSNKKWNLSKCKNYADKYIQIISKKYPKGLQESEYFILPKYEHVTRNQPIIIFNQIEGMWELQTITKFKI